MNYSPRDGSAFDAETDTPESKQMTSMTELGIAIDIISRMTIYTMAKSCDREEIEEVMEDIKLMLISSSSYPQETLDAMIEVYTNGTVGMSLAIDAMRGE